MPLNTFVAELRNRVFEEILAGQDPSAGVFSPELLAQGRVNGKPQMGSVTFTPSHIHLEFIFSNPATSAVIFVVEVESPERIVFMPVPEWVIENIWQGDIDGTYHFESEANALVQQLVNSLQPERNKQWFERRAAKRRE